MKKILIVILSFFLLTGIVKAEEFAKNAKSAVLMEYSTGKILFDKNKDERLAPASMTKIMTLLLLMEKIDNKEISEDDLVNISNNASSMGGSQMFLDEGSQVKISELIKGLTIASANDAAVAIAEYLGGSVDNFVSMMNEKTKELNLENTVFKNPHGLDEEGHYSSAKDMAIMARELIKHENILKYTSTYEEYFDKGNGNKTWLVNTNKLVRFYKGVDGLKTGYTKGAKYCLTATAKKNNIRFITVLMGEETSDLRSKETTELLNYAFNNYKLNTIIGKDNVLKEEYVEKSINDKVEIVTKNDVNEVILNNQKIDNYTFNIKVSKLVAPIKKGDIVGSLEIKDKDGLIVREEDITVKDDVNKISYLELLLKSFKVLLSGK